MRLATMSLVGLLVSACDRPTATVEPGAGGATAATTPADATTAAPDPAWDEREAFLRVFDALQAGDWAGFERFAGATIEYERGYSLGDEPPTMISVAPSETATWLAEIAASWAPECLENPEPPCLTFNPLALGVMEDQELELRCDAGCCSHEPALLHNTPFLRQVCFDPAHRVTRVAVLDG